MSKQFGKYIPPMMSLYPPTTPNWYVTPEPMSLKQVSVAVANTEEYATIIAYANGIASSNFTTDAGQRLRIPPLQMNVYTDRTHPNYQALMNHLLGSLSPHLKFARPHQSCLVIIFMVVLSILAICLAPHLAHLLFGAVLNATEVTASLILARAISAALISAIGQGIGLGVGILQQFSWSDLLTSAITAGMDKA